MIRLGLALGLVLAALPAAAAERTIVHEAYADPAQLREGTPAAVVPQTAAERLRTHNAAVLAARDARFKAEAHQSEARQKHEAHLRDSAEAARRAVAEQEAAKRARLAALVARHQKTRQAQERAWDDRTRRALGTICQGC